jgi:hypothetical protein
MLKNPYRSTLNSTNLIAAAAPATVLNQFIELGRYTLPAGVALELGAGVQSGQMDAVGRIYADLRTAAAVAVNGMVRLDLVNPQNRVIATLFEGRTDSLRNATLADRRTYIPFPKLNSAIGQDWAIVMKLQGDAAAVTATAAQSTVLVDCTFYDVA